MGLSYKTTQINMTVGEQLRISFGNSTVFVWANNGGLHVHDPRKGLHRRKKKRLSPPKPKTAEKGGML